MDSLRVFQDNLVEPVKPLVTAGPSDNTTPTEEAADPLPIPRATLSFAAVSEAENLPWGSVHKLWSMLHILKVLLALLTLASIDAVDRTKLVKTVTYIDFVIVIDHSASMKMNNKLAFVQATIEYLISKLSDHHRFCLIKFNQDVALVTNGLLPMTPENKTKVRTLLHGIHILFFRFAYFDGY